MHHKGLVIFRCFSTDMLRISPDGANGEKLELKVSPSSKSTSLFKKKQIIRSFFFPPQKQRQIIGVIHMCSYSAVNSIIWARKSRSETFSSSKSALTRVERIRTRVTEKCSGGEVRRTEASACSTDPQPATHFFGVQLSGGWCAGYHEPFPAHSAPLPSAEYCNCKTSPTEKLIHCLTAPGQFHFCLLKQHNWRIRSLSLPHPTPLSLHVFVYVHCILCLSGRGNQMLS